MIEDLCRAPHTTLTSFDIMSDELQVEYTLPGVFNPEVLVWRLARVLRECTRESNLDYGGINDGVTEALKEELRLSNSEGCSVPTIRFTYSYILKKETEWSTIPVLDLAIRVTTRVFSRVFVGPSLGLLATCSTYVSKDIVK